MKSWLDDVFDWDGDGKLDLFESAAKFSYLSDMMEEDEQNSEEQEKDPWDEEDFWDDGESEDAEDDF